MADSPDLADLRRSLVAPTSRLVDFLRSLARSRVVPVRDVADHAVVWWLADRPDTLDLDTTAGPGDVLFTLDPVAAEPHPDIPPALTGWVDREAAADSSLDAPPLRERAVEHPAGPPPDVANAYRRWVDRWQVWAEADRRSAVHRGWYDTLAAAHQQLDQRSDEQELVVATGMLGWETPSGAKVRTHLLATRAGITLDPATGQLAVIVDPGALTRISDRELLDGEAGFEAARAEPVRQQIREAVPAPLGDGVKETLERWRTFAFVRSRPYNHDAWGPLDTPDTVPELRLAPALVLRKRDAATLIGYYDRMLEALSGPDAEAPLGLAQLVTALEPEERLAWLDDEGGAARVEGDPLFPLPTNAEQRQIIDRLRSDNGVVVQGPPGTGKSHSIANLVAALLAQGHRVLVTSQKSQALRVLADQLPDDIAELCVSMTDLGRGGSAELNRSVNAISSRFGNHNPVAHAATVAELSGQRVAQQRRVAELTESIRALRETETYEHPEVAPGYAGTTGAIGARLRDAALTCSWMPVPLPDGAPVAPPLSVEELGELRGLSAITTPERRARTAQQLPDLATLPSGPTVRAWIAAEAAATAEARAAATSLSRRLAGCPADVIDRVADELRAAHAALARLDLGDDLDAWDGADWRVEALADRLARRNATLWDQLAGLAGSAHAARAQLERVGLRQVSLPVFDASGPSSLGAQAAAGRALRDFLAGGGQLRRFMPKPVQRQAAPLLEGGAVDGVAPSTPELLDVVVAYAEAHATCAALADRWAVVGVDVDAGAPLVRRVGRLVDAADQLAAVDAAAAAVTRASAVLDGAGVAVLVADVARWAELDTALDALAVQREADGASAQVAEAVAALELTARATTAPPELGHATAALTARDADAYEAALGALADAYVAQAEQRRWDELHRRLHDAHPGLAQLLDRTAADAVWETRLATLPAAWAWARARTFFDAQRAPGRDAELAGNLEDAIARVESATARLAAAKAWEHTLGRMTGAQQQALRVYQSMITERGAGTGRYAAMYEREARQAMAAASGAVPAWIMPLAEVLETVPPDRNSFDVVIVDEASQASIEALFLLWLAPRVIVVGDDRQCTPSMVSHGELQAIYDRLDEYLPDIPSYLRVAFTPRSSLFSLLGTRFGSVIRLREHFRCMPEIITWSSRQFYSDQPLIPLRQFGADRMPPLRHTFVPGAYAEGSSARLRNPVEAAALADQVAACAADPAYAGRSFGVVVLQSAAQKALIEDFLHARLSAAEWEQRDLRVGTPPDFQGDQRHVMFISMVAAGTPRPVTSLEWQRRFNVAASRAKDQLWLFHSVTVDALSPHDLRRSLLSYVAAPPAPEATTRLGVVPDDVPHPAFDSLFEQRVYNRIRARGYTVTPQVEVNGRRIDLVVTGARGRLAVECDGDRWHSTPEQREADLGRELELKRVGWKFWRVRGSEFAFDPDAALAGLWSALDARGIHPHDVTGRPPTLAHAEDDGWEPAPRSNVDGLDGLDDDSADIDTLDEVAPVRPPAHRPAQPIRSANGPMPSGSAAIALPPVRPEPVARTPRGRTSPSASEVREWARRKGHHVGERGRLGSHVIRAWNSDHPERPFID